MNPRISLDQWRALIAVVDAGSYAGAAEALNKTQSSVSYAIAKIESLLEITLFERQGRRAVLTPAGQALARRARDLVDDAAAVEHSAQVLASGWESELRIAADIIFPTDIIFSACAELARDCPLTRIELIESVMSGTDEALLDGGADLALTARVPTGFLGQPLALLRFVAVAAPAHPLHQLDRKLSLRDLRQHRQLVIRDSGLRRRQDSGWLGAEQRWTVSQFPSSIQAICAGHGFAWLPETRIATELADGRLRPLPLQEGGERFVQTYCVIAEPELAGPATQRLAHLITQISAQRCAQTRNRR